MSKVKGTGTQRPYKVRRSWEDSKSQIASYSILENAKFAADGIKGSGYKVFKDGKLVYDPEVTENNITIESNNIEKEESVKSSSDYENDNKSLNNKKKGFFSRLFGRKEKE